MSLPRCPVCTSDNIQHGYPIINGHNHCGNCGHLAPVRDFHGERPLATPMRGRKVPLPVTHRLARAPEEPRHPQQMPKPEEHFWWQDQ